MMKCSVIVATRNHAPFWVGAFVLSSHKLMHPNLKLSSLMTLVMTQLP